MCVKINNCMDCRTKLPENLHFDKDLNIKLSHFSSAVDLTTETLPTQSEGTQAVSVVDYMAPEVLINLSSVTIDPCGLD